MPVRPPIDLIDLHGAQSFGGEGSWRPLAEWPDGHGLEHGLFRGELERRDRDPVLVFGEVEPEAEELLVAVDLPGFRAEFFCPLVR